MANRLISDILPQLGPAAASMRQVSNRVSMCNVVSGSNTQAGWRCWQFNYAPVTSLRIYFCNWYLLNTTGQETSNGGGDMTMRCAVEYPLGTFTPLATVTIPDLQNGYVDIPVTIPAFTKYRIHGDMNMAGSGRVPSMNFTNFCDRGNGDEYLVGAAGYGHITDGTVLGSGLSQGYQPALVMGVHDKQVWGIIGDSIAAGVGDNVFDPSGGRGTIGRALARFAPHVNHGCPGDRADRYLASNTNRKALMQLSGAKSVFLELGRNDLSSNRTAQNIIDDRASIRALYTGIQWFETTITPQTNSTDGWKTAANQTPVASGVETNRVTFNNTQRNNSALWGVHLIDTCRFLETKPLTNFTASISTTTMTVATITSGSIEVGDIVSGVGVTAGTRVTGLGTGIYGTGTYTITPSQTVAGPIAMTIPANEVTPALNGGVFRGGLSDDGTHRNGWGYSLIVELVLGAILSMR